MVTEVFLLTHEYPLGPWWKPKREGKVIGYFSTIEEAEATRRALSQKQGFRDHPSAFCIRPLVIDAPI